MYGPILASTARYHDARRDGCRAFCPCTVIVRHSIRSRQYRLFLLHTLREVLGHDRAKFTTGENIENAASYCAVLP